METTASPLLRRLWLRHRALLAWWLVSRALVLAALTLGNWLAWGDYLLFLGEPIGISDHVGHLLGAWDGNWYRDVATNGYLYDPSRPSNVAFFPLYPLLIALLGQIGLSPLVAASLIANLSFPLSLVAFHELGRRLLPAPAAYRSAVFLAIAPLSYAFTLSYPQSLALLLVSLAALAAYERYWLAAGICAFLAAFARPEALWLAIPLLGLAWQEWRQEGGEWPRALATAAAPALGLAAFPLYLYYATGELSAWSKAETYWGRHFSLDGPVHAVAELSARLPDIWNWRDAILLGAYVTLLALALRTPLPRTWLAASAIVICLPVMSGSFGSIGRFGLLAPAVWWSLGLHTERRAVDYTLRAVSLLTLVLLALLTPWRWP